MSKVKLTSRLQPDFAVTATCNTDVWQQRCAVCGYVNVKWRTQIRRIFWSRRLRVDICAEIPFLLIMSMSQSTRGITSMIQASIIQKRLDKLGDILERVTLKQLG